MYGPELAPVCASHILQFQAKKKNWSLKNSCLTKLKADPVPLLTAWMKTYCVLCCDCFFHSSDLNAKGCVHQAFEMYRLKSCIDFKPYEGEKTYIKFEKRDGYGPSRLTSVYYVCKI